ncbi:MAG: hypothetical protein ABIJ10_03240 [Candidatus Micrarchaeota archaeon]
MLNRLTGYIGSGLFIAAILVLIWGGYSNPQTSSGPVVLIGPTPEVGYLLISFFVFSGFLLSVITINRKFELIYLRFGILLGILTSSIDAFGGMFSISFHISEFVTAVLGLILITIFTTIGYAFGDLLKQKIGMKDKSD